MDKQSFSRYGGIVIVVIILAMMIAFATPFGSFVVDGVKDVLGNFGSTGGNAMDNDYGDIVDFPYPGTNSGGNNGGSGGGSGVNPDLPAGGEVDAETGEILDSWEVIINNVNNGTYATKYSVGNYKPLDLGPQGVVNMQIAAFDADILSDGTGNAPITWIAKELLTSNYKMNATETNADGWEASAMRDYLQTEVWALIPTDIQNAIVAVDKTYYDKTTNSTLSCEDKLWIPSYIEIFGDTSIENDGVVYSELFTDSASRIKYLNGSASYWWLRSAHTQYMNYFRCVYTNGNGSSMFADIPCGVALSFCFGESSSNNGNENIGGGSEGSGGGSGSGGSGGSGSSGDEVNSLEPGLYDANDVLLASWDELTTTYGMDVTKDYVDSPVETNFYKTNKASPYYVLTNNDELASGVKLIMGNVTSVGEYAFTSCNGLTSITIPASVTAIGNNVFFGWVLLENVTFEENSQLTSIGQKAFYNCQKLTTIKIPAGVTTIGNSAFNCCYGLKNVEIPASVTTMGYNVFGSCENLTSVTFDENSQLTSISATTFSNCYALTSVGPVGSGASVEIPAGVTTIGNSAFYRCYGLKNVEIPDGVVSIDETAFEYCTALTSLDLGNGVTTISKSAFKDCTSLTRVEIPDSVRTIGVWAFRNCTNITSLTVDVNNKKYYSAGDCIIETASKTLVVACGNSIIPNGVITIGQYAFADFQNITTIEIPDSVTTIDYSAFEGCTSLTSIIIPDRVTEISNYAFSGCTKLEGIIIPASVTTIGYEAFCNCTGLTNITFKGTMSQWNAITKGPNWNKNVLATYVQCSDGTVQL